MAALKCPNPSCPFLFDPTQVPPGAILTCPRCGMRFTLGPTTGYAPPPAFPPSATENEPVVPDAQPIFDDTSPTPPIKPPTATVADPPRRVSPTAGRPRAKGGFGFSAVGVALLVLGGLVAAIVLAIVLKRGLSGNAEEFVEGESRIPDKNCAFKMPGTPWEKDGDLAAAMGVNAFVLRRTEPPEAWVALAAVDFETRSPQQHELRDRMLKHLHGAFNDLPADFQFEPAKLAGHDARKCSFRARLKSRDDLCVGECYLLGHKGVGYWFYAWTAERDAGTVSDELEKLRGGFRTLDLRPNWTERVGTEAVYTSQSGKYRLRNFEKIWKAPLAAPADEDPKGDLLLKAELKSGRRGDFRPEAKVVVCVLPGAKLDEAGAYVRQRHTPDAKDFGLTDITELSGEPSGDPPVGDEIVTTPAKRLKVVAADPNASRSRDKLVVYAAIKVGDDVIVAEGSCDWTQRETWERRLVQLVGSLRP